MKTIIKYTFILTIFFVFTACEDVLEKGPLGTIGGDTVWSDPELVEAYFADLYDKSDLIEDGDATNPSGSGLYTITTVGDEGVVRNRGNAYFVTTGNLSSTDANARQLSSWSNGKWQYLRAINTAINELNDPASSLEDSFREERLGQAYFLRAFFNFRMVIRYGGIPLVMELQDANLSFEELSIPRSSEKETYDFIESDLNSAIDLLTGKGVDKSRINVDAVNALKSRAMLYAGSIAENNAKLIHADANGIIGINASEAQAYYNKSLEASKALMPAPFGSGSFALRPGATTEEYRNIFNDINSGNDTESIMIMQFTGVGGRENTSSTNLLPRTTPSTHAGWGNWVVAYYDTIEWFEYKDGTPGDQLPVGYPNNGSNLLTDNIDQSTFHDLDELFGDKDPRFEASMTIARMQLGSLGTAYMHRSVVDAAAAAAAGVPTRGEVQNVGQPSTIAAYKLGNDVNPQVARLTNNLPAMVFRISETYLNYAEAAFATGDIVGATNAINAIRTRAGLLPKTTVTLDDIKQERKVELIFEYHRYWDLKRWRDAMEPLSKERLGLHYIWDVANDEYALFKEAGDNRDKFFTDRHFYMPIPFNDLESNNWIQTPGYE